MVADHLGGRLLSPLICSEWLYVGSIPTPCTNKFIGDDVVNEQGKSFFSSISLALFFALLGFSFLPYEDLLSSEHLSDLFRSEVIAEQLLTFLSCASFLAFISLVSYVGAALITFVVHLVQRLYFLHKLRKPMIIYSADLNKSEQSDLSEKLDELGFKFAFVVCFFCLVCMLFAEWG